VVAEADWLVYLDQLQLSLLLDLEVAAVEPETQLVNTEELAAMAETLEL
jgi:hypothetical protein